ncbi:Protoplast secreted protein 2 [Candida tropicalis]
MAPPRTAIILYSLYHHIYELGVAQRAGVLKAGGQADIFQVPETLTPEILKLVKAPEKPDIPIAETKILTEYDAFLFGVPTRFGNFPAQWKRKYAGVFVSTGTLGGGQETTAINTLSTLAHHGIIYVPFGYGHPGLTTFDEIHGGSPWGAGTFAGSDGSRKVTDLEKAIAEQQGHDFYKSITKTW